MEGDVRSFERELDRMADRNRRHRPDWMSILGWLTYAGIMGFVVWLVWHMFKGIIL